MFKLPVGNQDLFLRGEDHSFSVLPSRNSREIRQDFLYILSFSPTYKPMQPPEDSKLSQNEQGDVMVCDAAVGQDWPCISWQQCTVCPVPKAKHHAIGYLMTHRTLPVVKDIKVAAVLQQKWPKIGYAWSRVPGKEMQNGNVEDSKNMKIISSYLLLEDNSFQDYVEFDE